jgi:hypothetical protein
MARTRQQWEDAVLLALTGAGLSPSTSSVALWKLIRDLCITIAMLFEGILEFFKADVDNALATKEAGSIYWYPVMIKAFQYGDTLIVDNGIVKYATVNPAAQIITQVSVREVDDEVVVVKVAKNDPASTSGAITNLNLTELNALKNYVKRRKPPGSKVNIFSNGPDTVYYEITFFYDPLYDEATITAAVQAALETFKAGWGFDGILYKSELQAAVTNVPGVLGCDLYIDLVYSSGGGLSNLQSHEELPAGYFNYDMSSILDAVAA